MLARPALALSFLALCAPLAASAAVDLVSTVRFGFVPQRAFQGQQAAASVVVRPSGGRCAATVGYAGSVKQTLPSVLVRSGKASWKWTVPGKAAPGKATISVTCGKAGRVARSFTVAGPPAAPARVELGKHGFSQRVKSLRRTVSYGIELRNPSPENDALDVTVLVNFVDAADRVVDTDTKRVAAVAAGSVFHLGGSTTIPDASPVSKLEIVTRIAGQAPKQRRSPAHADVLVQASVFEPAWVGAVVGEITNDHPSMLLSRATISTVIYDAAGAVIGGTTGSSASTLLPGVRAYFQASSGAGSIPFDRAASAGVSILARFEPTS